MMGTNSMILRIWIFRVSCEYIYSGIFGHTTRQLSDSLKAACEKYNKKEVKLAKEQNREPKMLPNITSHILRHTACTRMAEAGVDLKVIQAIMGHKRLDTTMNIYNHVNLQRLSQESHKMNSIVTLDFTEVSAM